MATNTLTLTTPTDRELVVTRMFDAPRQLVFETWTQCEHVKRWFGQGTGELAGWSLPVCEIDLRVGGKYRYGFAGPEGETMEIFGEYREVVPPERIVATENFDEQYFEVMGGETVTTTTFEERDGKTLVRLTTLYASKEARDSAIATGMESGMADSFETLDRLLAGLV